MTDISKLLSDSKALLKETGKPIRAVSKKRENSKVPRSEREVHNGAGYTYVYAETGKLILKARAIVEKRIGRTLQDHERVLYRDGDRKNCAEDNLVLAYKAGVPLDALTCGCCGARGQFIVEPKEP